MAAVVDPSVVKKIEKCSTVFADAPIRFARIPRRVTDDVTWGLPYPVGIVWLVQSKPETQGYDMSNKKKQVSDVYYIIIYFYYWFYYYFIGRV